MARSNSPDFASRSSGVPPLPPPPPPIPHPTRRLRRKGKGNFLADERCWTGTPKPTTTTHALNAALTSSPEVTTTATFVMRNSPTLPAQAPLVHTSNQAMTTQIHQDENFDRTGLKTRIQKLLVVDDAVADPRSTKPTLNVFAVIKKPAQSGNLKASNLKSANKQRSKAAATQKDPSYRPPKTDEWSSESDEDSDWSFKSVPGDLLALSQVTSKGQEQEQFSPVTSISTPTSSVSPPRPKRSLPPPPPPPILNQNRLKRRRISDPTYRPSRNSEESSFDDDGDLDEGVEALKRVVKNHVKVNTVRRKAAERQGETVSEEEKSQLVLKGANDEKRKPPMKKNRKSVLDPSYKPPKDEEGSEDNSNEYTSTDGGNRRWRKRVRTPDGDDDPNKNYDDYGNFGVDDNSQNDVIPQEEVPPCQAHPCHPPKFGRRKVNRRSKPPRIYDPSYKPGTTSSDNDSNSIDSSWSSKEGKDRKKKRRKPHQPQKAPKKNQTVSNLQQEVIRLMLEETKPKPAFVKKRKRPRLIRRHTSDQSFYPSGTPWYSDEWYSSGYSSELNVKTKKRKKGTKKKDQWNVNRVALGSGPVTEQVLDLNCGRPVEASEEDTRESVKLENYKSASRAKTGRTRIGTLDAVDFTYEPSTSSPSSESEPEAIPDLDRSVPSLEISNDNEKPELILEPKGEVTLPSVTTEREPPQIHSGHEPLSNIKTAFYPLCHGHYSPWPPARGTVYCQPCFREQVIVRGLLIRRGISETLRLLKMLLGGGSDFGYELNEALEEFLGGVVETEQMGTTRVEDHGQGQDDKDQREEGVQQGQDTHTKPMPSAQSSLAELPEDVRTLLVLRRLSDVVNTMSMSTMSTARSSGSGVSLTTPSSLHFPSNANTASPDPANRRQDPSGPSRYSTPIPPCPAQIPRGKTHNHIATSIGINASYVAHKPSSTRFVSSLPAQTPQNSLENAINILHDALGISTWQARRLWYQYEGAGIWDLAQVDSLVKESHAKFLNEHQIIEEFAWAKGEESNLEVGVRKDENDQAVMLGLEGLVRLEQEIMTALAEKGSREEENEGRTRHSDRDESRFGRDHAQSPNKTCKLTKPIDLTNPTGQEALPVSPRRRKEQPRVIPCHSCSRFNAVNYTNCAAARRNDYTEMGGRPWVETLQWTFNINELEAAKMTLNNLLDVISRHGKAAHVKSSGWEFVVHRPSDHHDAELRFVFLDVKPGLDLHL